MRKLTRKSLTELSQQKEILSAEKLKTFIGGGNGTYYNPYTFEEYKQFDGKSEGYYINESGQLSYNLPEIVVTGHQSRYNGNTSSLLMETQWSNYGWKSNTDETKYENSQDGLWSSIGSGGGYSTNDYNPNSSELWYNGNSAFPAYTGGSWGNISKVADGIGVNMAIKEAVMSLVDEAQLGKTASRYLTFTKIAGKACSIIGVGIAIKDAIDNPTLGNKIQVAISFGAMALGPVGSAIYCVIDMTGGVDYISDTIASKIEEGY